MRDGVTYRLFQFGIIRAAAQHVAQVEPPCVVEAELQLSVRRQPHAVAGFAELMADCADQSDGTLEAIPFRILCRPVTMFLAIY